MAGFPHISGYSRKNRVYRQTIYMCRNKYRKGKTEAGQNREHEPEEAV